MPDNNQHEDAVFASEVDEPVHLCSYSSDWPVLFISEMERIKPALQYDCVIEHIGSTSVPGMMAKPIIDMMLGIQPFPVPDDLRARLVSLGYEDCGEAGVSGRLYFRRRATDSFNLHVTALEGPIWEANLALRDYLRSDSEARAEYTQAKHSAIANGCNTLIHYSDHKSATIHQLITRALERKRSIGAASRM